MCPTNCISLLKHGQLFLTSVQHKDLCEVAFLAAIMATGKFSMEFEALVSYWSKVIMKFFLL